MADELDRIESIYGSVAEYNRVRFEEDDARDYEETDEQRAKREKMMKDYDEEIEALQIAPTETANQLKSVFKQVCDKNDSTSYTDRDIRTKALHEAMSGIAENYGKKFEQNSYPKQKKGTFAISYQYTEGGGTVKTATVNDLDKETFMKMYADMYSLGWTIPQTSYRDTVERKPNPWGLSQDMHSVQNISLGEMRRNYFDGWGVPNDDAHNVLDKVRSNREALAESIAPKATSDEGYQHDVTD